MSKQCENFLQMNFKDGSNNGLRKLSCPSPGQPVHYTECCAGAGEELYCCPAATFLQQMDSNVVMIVALIVIGSCVIAIICILVCCFSSRCPLYNVCRVNYTQGGVIAYNKEEDPLTSCMPGDGEGLNYYSPNAIKIKPVEDV